MGVDLWTEVVWLVTVLDIIAEAAEVMAEAEMVYAMTMMMMVRMVTAALWDSNTHQCDVYMFNPQK